MACDLRFCLSFVMSDFSGYRPVPTGWLAIRWQSASPSDAGFAIARTRLTIRGFASASDRHIGSSGLAPAYCNSAFFLGTHLHHSFTCFFRLLLLHCSRSATRTPADLPPLPLSHDEGVGLGRGPAFGPRPSPTTEQPPTNPQVSGGAAGDMRPLPAVPPGVPIPGEPTGYCESSVDAGHIGSGSCLTGRGAGSVGGRQSLR